MRYEANLFFNFPAFKDTIFLVIDNDKIPDKIEKKGNFVALYNSGKLIGVNIFNSNEYLKLKIDGLFHNPNEPLVNLINSLIKAYLGEDVVLVQAPLYLAQINQRIDKHIYKLNLGNNREVYATNTSEEIDVGDFVLVSYAKSRLDDGNLTSKFLLKGTDYLIVAVEDTQLNEEVLGSSTHILKEKK